MILWFVMQSHYSQKVKMKMPEDINLPPKSPTVNVLITTEQTADPYKSFESQ